MSDNCGDLNLYFEGLGAEQLAYLELLETRHPKFRDTHNTLHHMNPLHKQEFLQGHLAYMDGDEIAELRVAADQYAAAKYNAAAVFGGTLFAFCLYRLGTAPKTSKMSRFAAQGSLLGAFGAGLYMAYEHRRLTDTLGGLFVAVMQKKIRERSGGRGRSQS